MKQAASVWVVDDDNSIRWVVTKALTGAGFNVEEFASADTIVTRLQHEKPDVILTDIRMPGIDGLTLLKQIQAAEIHVPVIIVTAHSDLESAVASYQGGAFEYLPKPFDVDEVISLVDKALKHTKQQQQLDSSKEIITPDLPEMIGEAPAMQEVFRIIGRLSQSNATVLITGESGTGKELVANALHKHSSRCKQAFVPLNMAAIPHDLIESELFGFEKGSFTGAVTARHGRFVQANGGTLFLDEIGDMPAEAQTRLLRVLADHEFYPVGSYTPVKVDVRIIAATHQNLEERVKQGLFREDLFHRLNVIRIQLPALSERKEDIPKLTQYFLTTLAKKLDVPAKTLATTVVEHFCKLNWPGNIRQLQNVCRWLTLMTTSHEIQLDDLPADLKNATTLSNSNSDNWTVNLAGWAEKELKSEPTDILGKALPLFEKTLIEASLKHTLGRRSEAAKILGWSRNTLTRKINNMDIKL